MYLGYVWHIFAYSEAKLNLSAVKKVWGKEGIINKNQEPKTSELQSEITNVRYSIWFSCTTDKEIWDYTQG